MEFFVEALVYAPEVVELYVSEEHALKKYVQISYIGVRALPTCLRRLGP